MIQEEKMKKFIETVKKAFFYTTAIFTAVICVFMLVFLFQGMEEKRLMDIGVLECSLVFAAISGACIAVVGIFQKLPAIFRYIIDFVLSYAAFFLWFKMLAASAANILPSHFFMLSTVYAVVFAVAACFAALISKLSSGKKTAEYEGMLEDTTEEK